MTYLFSSNVEVSNDIGNALPITVTNDNGNIVSLANPFPVTLGSNSIQIIGNISIPTTVNVASSPDDPVHTHITEIGTSGNLLALGINYMPINGNVIVTGNVGIVGNVNVNPITVTSITSNVNVNPITGNVHVYGNVGIDGNVNVTQGTDPWHVDGNIGLVANSSVQVVYPAASTSAFDEQFAISITPLIQADAVHGLDPDVWTTTQVNGGNVTVTDHSTWEVSTGTSAGGYARLKTSRYLRYQPGQGSLARWTAAFTCTGSTKLATGVDNIYQLAGMYGREDGYAFGYSGDPENSTIGILHRYAGRVEIRTLTITTAPTGNQTVAITLNGVVYNSISITAGTEAETAAAIGHYLKMHNATAKQFWDIVACNNTITFGYYTGGARNGTYSMSSTGAGTIAAGTFARTQTGIAATDDWTYVNAWNGTPINFNPSMLNVYSVDYRWLGAGRVRFFMENPANGEMVLVHTQIWSSLHTVPHLDKPSLRIGYRAGSTSGATPSRNVVVTGASVMAGVAGMVNQTGHSEGWFDNASSSKAKDLVHHLISIQNPYVRNGQINSSQLVIQNLTVAAQGTDPSTIFIIVNPTGTSTPLVFAPIPGPANSRVFAQASTTAATEDITMDNLSNVQTLAINGSATFDLAAYNFNLAPSDIISVFITSTNGLTRTSVGITWKVD